VVCDYLCIDRGLPAFGLEPRSDRRRFDVIPIQGGSMNIPDLIRTIILWTLGLSAAYLVLTKSDQFNKIMTSLTRNWAGLLVVSRGERLPNI
jgi:hypothetical protein